MKRTRTFISSLLFVGLMSSGLFANGLSLNSIGPRALGMGGAFVGLSNDLTAIYWNPAGLAQMKGLNVEAFATDIIPMATYKWNFPAMGINIDAKMEQEHYISPNIFGSYSFGDMTVGLGVYVPAGLGAKWKGSELLPLSNGKVQEWLSKIAVINISPAIGYKASDNLMIGAALNVYYGMFDLKRPSNYLQLPDPNATSFQYDEESTGLGYGLTVGALVKIVEDVQLGLTWRTKTTVSMSGTAKNQLLGLLGGPTNTDFDRDVAWPMWLAAGLAFKPADNLTITVDAQMSQWKESSDVFQTDYKDPTWKAATGQTGDDKFELHWKNATQFRMGAEYWLSDQFALRGGYYYDPAPAPDETLIFLFPSSTNDVATVGASFKTGNIDVHFGMEYLFGQERRISAEFVDGNPMLGFKNAQPGRHHMDIFAFSLGVALGL